MTKDDALTTLGKFIDIQITEQQSTEAAGTVIAQDPEAYAAADPDQPISITISSGDQAPSTDSTASTDPPSLMDRISASRISLISQVLRALPQELSISMKRWTEIISSLEPTRLHSRKLSDHAGKDNQRYCRILLRICRRR